MSRQELADAANRYLFTNKNRHATLTANYVGKLERGQFRWPDRDYREAFRKTLDAPSDSALGFFITRPLRVSAGGDSQNSARTSSSSATPATSTWRTASRSGQAVQSEDADPASSGRSGCQASSTIAGAVELAHASPSTLTSQSDVGWAEMLRRTVLKLPVAASVVQLTAPGESTTSDALDPALIRGLVAVSDSYRRAYQAVPASRLLPAALSHLDLLTALRPASRPESERRPLVTAAGETAALAGVLLALDAVRQQEALSYFDVAWAAARAADNIELQTVVLGCRSFALAYGAEDHQAGLECADLARRIGERGACPQTRAWVAAVASERCAALGDLDGCRARLDESRTALSSTEFADVTWRGVGGYNSDKLRAYEGGDMVRLGRFQEAEAILDGALGRLAASMTRHRATALLDRADAHLGLGEVEAACSDASQALSLVAHVEHAGHLDRVDGLSRRAGEVDASAAGALNQELRLIRLDHRLPTKGTTG